MTAIVAVILLSCCHTNSDYETEQAELEREQLELAEEQAELKKEQADALILGCTELPLILSDDTSPLPCLDTVKIHSDALISASLES